MSSRMSFNFHRLLQQGKTPVPYILIQTPLGWRCYAEKELGEYFEVGGAVADGTYAADGSITAGSAMALLEKSARVHSFGSFNRTIAPVKRDVLAALTTKQQQSMTVVLKNEGNYFARLLPKEPFLLRPFRFYFGFEALPFADHLQRFTGKVAQVRVADDYVTVRAIES